MSENNEINWSVAEKFSYAYVDEKYAKIATIATGDAKLVDPLAWSYAETHSYVEVDPSSVGVSVPSGVSKLYAKVIYVPGGGSSSSAASSVVVNVESDPLFAEVSGTLATISYADDKFNALSAYCDNISSLVLSVSGNVESSITAEVNALSSEFNASIQSVSSALEDLIDARVNAVSSDFESLVNALSSELGDNVQSVSAALEDLIDIKVNAVSSDFGSLVNVLSSEFNASVQSVSAALEDSVSASVNALSAEFKTDLQSISGTLEDFANSKIADLSAEFDNKVQELSGTVSDSYYTKSESDEALSSSIDAAKDEIKASMSGLYTKEEVDEMIAAATSDLNKKIEILEIAVSGRKIMDDRVSEGEAIDLGDRVGQGPDLIFGDRVEQTAQPSSQQPSQSSTTDIEDRLAMLEAMVFHQTTMGTRDISTPGNIILGDRTSEDQLQNGLVYGNRV